MFDTIAKVMKWILIPLLLLAAPFAFMAESYEPLVGLAICVGAVFFLQRAVRLEQYFGGAGWLAIIVVFSPFLPMTKISLLMGFTCVAIILSLVAVFRTQPVAAL
jgi:hypothetical protein